MPKGELASSVRWDEDWERIRWCWDPRVVSPLKGSTYRYGSLEGDWMGRMLVSGDMRAAHAGCSQQVTEAPGLAALL